MGKKGQRLTVDERIAKRDQANVAAGTPAGWADEALNYYLSNVPIKEILDLYGISSKRFYQSIANAALYRLMKLHRSDDLAALFIDEEKKC